MREYLKNFNEPYKDNETAKIYEWENKDGVRFRVVTDKHKEEGHSNTPLSPFADVIITFYSDRNLNKPMKFKNPKVEEYYQQQKTLQNPAANKKKVFSKNPQSTPESRSNEVINRLLTAHSKTEVGERRQSRADRVSSATYFNDPNFRGSASETIPQNTEKEANNKNKFSKNPQSTPESRSKLQTKMSAVAN